MFFPNELKRNTYQKLSPEIQEFVMSGENSEIVSSLASKFELDTDQTDVLESETFQTMIGLESIEQMTSELKTSLGLPDEKIHELMNELKNHIFNQLEAIKNNRERNVQDRFVQTPTNLKPNSGEIPSNLPTEASAEEKILGTIGTPGEKLAWEQRKQIAASALPKGDEKKYNGVDPYREPLS